MKLRLNGGQVAVLLVLAAALVAVWPTCSGLARAWFQPGYDADGYVLTALVFGWILVRSATLPRLSTRGWGFASGLLLIGMAAWMVAYRSGIAIVQQALIPPLLWATVWMSCGWAVAARMAAPILFLYFALPVWEALTPVLQQLTVWGSKTMLGWLGVPTRIDDVFVTIPEGRFQIEGGCSGTRYFVVALAIAILFGTVHGLRPRLVVAYAAISGALAILTNWVRVVTIIYAGHLTQMHHYLVVHEHKSFGWALFALLLAVQYWIGMRLVNSAQPAPAKPLRSPLIPVAVSPPRIAMIWLGLVLVLGLPMLQFIRVPLQRPLASTAPLTLPALHEHSWDGPTAPSSQWTPSYPGASWQTRATYEGPRGPVEVFIAQYQQQRQDAKLIGFQNTLLSKGWIALEASHLQRDASLATPHRIAVLWVETGAGERWCISYVYQVSHFVTTRAPLAQLAYGVLSWWHDAPARIIAAATRCGASCTEAEQDMTTFWNRVGGPFLAQSGPLREW